MFRKLWSKTCYEITFSGGTHLLGCMMLQLEICSKYWTVATNPRQPKRFFSETFSRLLRCLAYTCCFIRFTEAAQRIIECFQQLPLVSTLCSLTIQNNFLLFVILKKTGMKHEVVGLQLPFINMSSLQVIYEDHRTYASQASVSCILTLWKNVHIGTHHNLPRMFCLFTSL